MEESLVFRSTKTHVLGTHWKHLFFRELQNNINALFLNKKIDVVDSHRKLLVKALPMGTHNIIMFFGEIRIISITFD